MHSLCQQQVPAFPLMTTSSSVAIAVLVDVGYFEARKKMKMHPVSVEEEERDCLGKIEQQKSVLLCVFLSVG